MIAKSDNFMSAIEIPLYTRFPKYVPVFGCLPLWLMISLGGAKPQETINDGGKLYKITHKRNKYLD